MRSEHRNFSIRTAVWLTVVVLCSAIGPTMGYAEHPAKPMFTMNSQGELKQPVGYREWIYVGAPVTPNDLNKGKAPFPEFHSVYIDPASWAHWKKTGKFRENTILVKELISVGSKEAASGNGYFMGEFIGLEATVKSAKLFPKEPGHWGYFSFTNADGKTPKPTAAVQPVDKCNSCHDDNADQDWVFTQYYPVLRGALKK
jgi:Cytochrome P460